MLAIDGRLSLGPGAVVEIDLTDGSSDRIDVSGSVGLAGELAVSIDLTPHLGELFEVLTYDGVGGVFGTLTLPAAYEWEVVYGLSALTLEVTGLAGDFNGDGAVDAADYTVWRNGFGTVYGPADLDAWRAGYGSSLLPTPASVPEPVAAWLLAIAGLGYASVRIRTPHAEQ